MLILMQYIICRAKRKRTTLSNNDNDNIFIPISKQLDKKIKDSSHVSAETIVANPATPTITHSVLPRSVDNQRCRHSNIEDIQPTTTTNEDLEYLHTRSLDKFMNRG